jgi:hypothetical protein
LFSDTTRSQGDSDVRQLTLLAAILVACQCSAVEPAGGYVAKIKFIEVSDGGKQSRGVQTEIGVPFDATIGGWGDRDLNLDIRQVPGTKSAQWQAHVEFIERSESGKQKVLCSPTLITVVGRPASILIGEEKGDRIEFELVVKEVTRDGVN